MNVKAIRTTLITLLAAVLLLPLTLTLTSNRAEAAVPAHSESFYVNDFANVIDEKTENYMVNYGVKLNRQTGAQVVLVTVDSTNGASLEEYATSLFNAWGVGSADKNNGVLLLLSIKDDDYWAVPGKGLETALNENVMSQILSSSLEPDFAKKDYSAGARKTYGSLIQSLGGIYSETLGTKNYVSDNAGVFKQITKDYLNQSSNRYAATTGSGMYVVTVNHSGVKSLQDYTYDKFAGVAAGPNDVMLVLDISGDNYHVLQGNKVDKVLTNEVISGILDTALEPKFAAKDYAGGATKAVNAIYSFLLARADHSQKTVAASSAPAPAEAAGSTAVQPPAKQEGKYTPPPKLSVPKALFILGIFLLIVALISVAASARNRLVARYGIRINPHSERNIRRFGIWTGQPGYGMSQRRRYRQHRHLHDSPNSGSQSSFWESNGGGGGSSSGGGAGRSSSSRRETNHGGGGSSSGGGAGRHSSESSSSGGSSRSSSGSSGGGSNSGGGGNASGGGGVGRHR